jgi:peptidyl-prolyl cis-trans isomerase SurA
LISATPSKSDIVRAQYFLDSIRDRIVKDSIKFEKAAIEFSDDQRSKGRGGYFTDEEGGTKISIKELDPVVYFSIDTMREGSISRSIVYRTEDFKDAARILYFKRRLSPHQANLQDDWHRIQAAALSQKKDKMMEKWFAKAKTDVFIKIDPAYKQCKVIDE